ncbi:MAG: hypothetical protein ABEJ66_02385 [Candidatus Nanohaloarchaea archaeon]
MEMRRRKGQFLLISAVIVGLMMISTASTIRSAESQRFSHGSTIYDVNMLKNEATKVDMGSTDERESFRRAVNYLPGYTSTVRTWDRESDGDYDCFNVTLRRPGDRLHLNCIG